MAANPVDIGMIKNLSGARKISGTVGASTLKVGLLCKVTAGLFVTVAADDVPTTDKFYVCTQNAAASATAVFVPFSDVLVAMAYTAAPTVGVAYGVNDGSTLDQSDTTNLAVVAVEVDTDLEVAWVIQHNLSA